MEQQNERIFMLPSACVPTSEDIPVETSLSVNIEMPSDITGISSETHVLSSLQVDGRQAKVTVMGDKLGAKGFSGKDFILKVGTREPHTPEAVIEIDEQGNRSVSL
jgi:hypothetical protein